MSPEEEESKLWLEKNKRNIFYFGAFAALIFLGLWMSSFKIKTDFNLGYPEYSSAENIIVGDPVPDFKSWVIKKEGEVDADLDGKNDFKLRYYLKDREDAVALFMPFDNSPPKILIYAHYPNNIPYIFAPGFYIGFGVFEDSRWTLMNFNINDKYARIVKEELKKFKIKTREVELLVRIMNTNFNIRNPKANKKEESEAFVL